MRHIEPAENYAPLFTTEELILALKQRNEQAIDYLYDYYAPALLGVICKIIGDVPEAEELLQDVFLKVWLHIDRYDETKGRFYTWLITLARNESIDLLRSKTYKQQQKQQVLYAEKEYTTINTNSYLPQDHFDMYKFVGLLPKLERNIILLAFYQGFSCKQIGDTLHMPEGTVKTYMQRSYKKLKPVLFQPLKANLLQ